MPQQSYLDTLNLPEQSLKKLSFCKANSKSLAQWYFGLSQVNPVGIAQSLISAIDELCQLQCKNRLRLELLETLQSYAHSCIEQLSKLHLSLSTSSPKKAIQVLKTQLTLQQKLAYSFTICAGFAAQNIQRLLNKRQAAIFGQAVILALQETRACLLSFYQQYQFKLDRLWQRSHALYQLSQQWQFAESRQIQAEYKHLLLWGCTHAHQINQQDFSKLDTLFADWQERVGIVIEPGHANYAYFIDQSLSTAPVSERVFKGQASLALNLSALLAYLKQPEASLELHNAHLPSRIVAILSHSWGASSDRVFERLNKQAHLHYVTGLRACHYFLSDEVTLAQLIQEQDNSGNADQKAQFSSRKSAHEQLDPWQQSVYGNEYRSEAQSQQGEVNYQTQTNEQAEQTHNYEQLQAAQAKIVNISPAGYQLELSAQAANQHAVDIDQLILIKEEHHEHWDLAIIRWLKRGASIQLGIELFQPHIIPCAVAQCDRHGQANTGFFHALLLPEYADGIQDNRIIVPTKMLKQGQQVCILTQTEKQLLTLNKLLQSNSHYALFTYQQHQAPQQQQTQQANQTKPVSTVWEIL